MRKKTKDTDLFRKVVGIAIAHVIVGYYLDEQKAYDKSPWYSKLAYHLKDWFSDITGRGNRLRKPFNKSIEKMIDECLNG